jgi:hypothetical protein
MSDPIKDALFSLFASSSGNEDELESALDHYRGILAERNLFAERCSQKTEELIRLRVELYRLREENETLQRDWIPKWMVEKKLAEIARLRLVVQMVVASQGWDGNDPDNDAWTMLYRKAREALIEKGEEI